MQLIKFLMSLREREKQGGILRDHGVGGDDVLHLFGPGVHEAEPAASQSDEGAVFDLKLITVRGDLFPHLQN